MHSNDFSHSLFREKPEKTQKQHEQEMEVVGIVNHLKGLGWEDYQWNEEQGGHFAEFFSPYYHGYLRGDSSTSVREAMEKCLVVAQKFAACEVRTGHEYKPKTRRGEEFTNGLVECIHCGFNGFSPQVETLKTAVRNLQIHLKVERELFAEDQRKKVV